MSQTDDKWNDGSITSGSTVSYWIDSTSILAFQNPHQDITT